MKSKKKKQIKNRKKKFSKNKKQKEEESLLEQAVSEAEKTEAEKSDKESEETEKQTEKTKEQAEPKVALDELEEISEPESEQSEEAELIHDFETSEQFFSVHDMPTPTIIPFSDIAETGQEPTLEQATANAPFIAGADTETEETNEQGYTTAYNEPKYGISDEEEPIERRQFITRRITPEIREKILERGADFRLQGKAVGRAVEEMQSHELRARDDGIHDYVINIENNIEDIEDREKLPFQQKRKYRGWRG